MNMGYGKWRKCIFRGIEVPGRPPCEHPRVGSLIEFRCPGRIRLSMRTLFDYYGERWVVKKIGLGNLQFMISGWLLRSTTGIAIFWLEYLRHGRV